jgi:hypothetical protein
MSRDTTIRIIAVITINTDQDSTDVAATLYGGTARVLTIPGPVTLATLTSDGKHLIEADVLSVDVQSVEVSKAV